MYLGIYLKKNNKKKNGKKKKEKKNEVRKERAGLKRQTPLKMIEPRKTAPLTVKKNNNNKNRTHFMTMNE